MVDRTDEQIARFLMLHPEGTVQEAAAVLSLSRPTAQRRIAKMIEDGVIAHQIAIYDWAAVGYPFRYRIDVSIDQEALREPPFFGAPSGEHPKDPVTSWRRLARYIARDLISFLEHAHSDVVQKKISKDDLIIQDVMRS